MLDGGLGGEAVESGRVQPGRLHCSMRSIIIIIKNYDNNVLFFQLLVISHIVESSTFTTEVLDVVIRNAPDFFNSPGGNCGCDDIFDVHLFLSNKNM